MKNGREQGLDPNRPLKTVRNPPTIGQLITSHIRPFVYSPYLVLGSDNRLHNSVLLEITIGSALSATSCLDAPG